MFLVLRLLIVALLGAGLGLGSVWFVLETSALDAGTAIGPWRVQTGETGSDRHPYAAARASREGRIGLGPAEGVAFEARFDAAGQPFNPACHYTIEGALPPADLWTLAVTDDAGHLPRNPAGRTGFTSRDAIRQPDGGILITVGRTARPGNFVPTGSLASLVFTLRIYAPGLSARLPGPELLPAIRRLSCGPASGVRR
ncbi:DUF1214 domain-containing protein [Chthonobacter albigriseus]|uniref:DUF1214 domain-containing protein n=1 Tax=Chthonobacter albigriseus TaxID=1683161 RepID=UPI0015EFB8E2